MKSRIMIIFTSLLLFTSLIPMSSVNAASQVFSDVPKNHSNFADIDYLLKKGVIKQAKTYGVKDIVTREEVAVMVAKAVGLDGTQRATKFSDVPMSNPNSGYIQSAVEAGIINGYGDSTFKPNTKVNRGHMAAFIARAFDLPAGTKTFKDVPKGHTAYEAVKQLAAAEITTGYGDSTFKPANNLTRAHISAFLARAIRYTNGEKVIPYQPTGKVYPDGWVAPVLKSSWSSNHKENLETLENELDFVDGGHFYNVGLNQRSIVVNNELSSTDEVTIKFYAWTDPSVKESDRIPIVAKELFKLYFANDATKVWNYVNSGNIPDKFTANGRTVQASIVQADGSLYFEVGYKK